MFYQVFRKKTSHRLHTTSLKRYLYVSVKKENRNPCDSVQTDQISIFLVHLICKMYISSINNINKIHRNLSFNITYTVFSSSFSLLSMSFLFVRMTKPLFIIIICHLHSIRVYFVHLVSFISRLIQQFSLFENVKYPVTKEKHPKLSDQIIKNIKF